MKTSVASALLMCVMPLALVSCKKMDLGDDSTGPVTVSVSRPVQKDVTPYAQFIGRTEAVNAVEIKSRVTGYLVQTPVKEGTLVKAGDLICQIDPRTYQAQYDAADGQLQATQARYKLAKDENARAQDLYKQNAQAISLKALDQHQAAEDAAAADVIEAKSSLEAYKLNLDFTNVTSPIDGRMGRYQVTLGNLVTENATTVTSVVTQDPVYVYFNIDEQTMLRLVRQLFDGAMPPLASRKIQVQMGLQDETGFPHTGTADFADNQVDPTTGTLTIRAAFPNPPSPQSPNLRLLLPGMFVRVHLPLSLPRSALLIADEAIATDQSQKYVYVVDDSDTVQYRRVELGILENDGLRVITDGIKPEDQVIVNGLQLVSPRIKVKTEVVKMPTYPSDPSSNATGESSTPAPSTSGESSDS